MKVGDYVVTFNNYGKFMEQYRGIPHEDIHIPYGLTNDAMLIARVVKVWDDIPASSFSSFLYGVRIEVLNHKLDDTKCGEVYDVDDKYFRVIDENLVNTYVDFMVENHGFCEII